MGNSKKRKNSNYQTEKTLAAKKAKEEAEAEKAVEKAAKNKSDTSEHKLWLRIVMLVLAIVTFLSFVMLPIFDTSAADDGIVTVTEFEMGKLSEQLTKAMGKTDRNNIYKAYISGGTLNSADYNAINEIPNLEVIDISGCDTENGIIPGNALAARNQLTELSLPQNTEIIGKNAFGNNKKLKNITLSSNLKEIGDYAFDSCIALTNISVPDSVTKIGEGAFRDCQSLASFTLPSGVTEIPAYCFSKCVFTEFYITPSVTSISEGAFSDCHELRNIYIYGDNAPTLEGQGVFQNLNVTVHTSDTAEGYDTWENNFVSTETGFNEEYVATETEQETETSAQTESTQQTESTSEEISESESVTESEQTTAVDNIKNEASDEANGFSTASVIIIAILVAALTVMTTLFITKKKK